MSAWSVTILSCVGTASTVGAMRRCSARTFLAADEVVPVDRNDTRQHRERLLRENLRGFDYVIEATCSSQLCNEALQYARPGGHIVVYGVYPADARLNWSPYEIFQKQLTIVGSFAQTHCFDRALAYLESHQVKVNEMVTHEFALEDYI